MSRTRFVEFGSWSNTSFQERRQRYELMLAMRYGLAPFDRRFSLREIAGEPARRGYGLITRERTRQLLAAGAPVRQTQALETIVRRRQQVEQRMLAWESHRTPRGDARAAAYRSELDDILGSCLLLSQRQTQEQTGAGGRPRYSSDLEERMQSPWLLKLDGKSNSFHPSCLQSSFAGTDVKARSPTPPALVNPTSVSLPDRDKV
jgi:hypothetical protein